MEALYDLRLVSESTVIVSLRDTIINDSDLFPKEIPELSTVNS